MKKLGDDLTFRVFSINCDTGQHSQFLRCFCWFPWFFMVVLWFHIKYGKFLFVTLKKKTKITNQLPLITKKKVQVTHPNKQQEVFTSKIPISHTRGDPESRPFSPFSQSLLCEHFMCESAKVGGPSFLLFLRR